MSTIHLHQTTTSTPEQFIAGLTDFGPGRSRLFGNSADEYLKVHDRGRSEADLTEGSGGIWERLHYDWSDPNRVVMTTTDSNVGEARRATPTPSPSSPTGGPTSTSSWYARARTSRDGCSAWCSEASASACWQRRLKTPSRRLKRGTTEKSLGSHVGSERQHLDIERC